MSVYMVNNHFLVLLLMKSCARSTSNTNPIHELSCYQAGHKEGRIFMKKVCIMILVLTFALSMMVSMAEERFSVRNGIVFGMSMDEVESIEIANNTGEYTEKTNDDGTIELRYTPKSVAGIDNGIVYYTFDDDKLIKIKYRWFMTWAESGNHGLVSEEHIFNDKKDADNIYRKFEEDYSSITDALSGKYEQVGYINNGEFHILDVGNLDFGIIDDLKRDTVYTRDNIYDIIGFDEYLAQDDNDYVAILSHSYRADDKPYIIDRGYVLKHIQFFIDVEYRPVDGQIIRDMIENNKGNCSVPP